MFGMSLQRALLNGEDELNGTVLARSTVTTVVENGKVTPPSVERANITLFGELIGLGPPQHIPLCQRKPMVPLGWVPIEGNSLWFTLRENSVASTMGSGLEPGGFQVCPASDDQRSVTLL